MTVKTINRGLLIKALVVFAFAIAAALAITILAVPSPALAESRLDIEITRHTPSSECVYGNKVEFSVSYDAGSGTVGSCHIETSIGAEIVDEYDSEEQNGTYQVDWNADTAGSLAITVKATVEYKDGSTNSSWMSA